jgi:hypothetical protein
MQGEIVPKNVSEKDLKDEVNRRTARAGYTARAGESPYRTKIQTTVCFGKEKFNVWPRNPITGELVND